MLKYYTNILSKKVLYFNMIIYKYDFTKYKYFNIIQNFKLKSVLQNITI